MRANVLRVLDSTSTRIEAALNSRTVILSEASAEGSGTLSFGIGEYSAIEVRALLQQIFPKRKLVLSQLTLYMQLGVCQPSGQTTRRKRRCFRLEDLLPLAVVMSLKEQGVPLKNLDGLPELLRENVAHIFSRGQGCRLSGFAGQFCLQIPGVSSKSEHPPLQALLGEGPEIAFNTFWGIDVGLIAEQLIDVSLKLKAEPLSPQASLKRAA